MVPRPLRGRLATAALCAALACGPGPHERPNILVISIDTLRADHLGLYGAEQPTSPRIDALGAEGVVFENARASSSWTLPSFGTALTSLAPSTHGATTLTARLDESFRTLPEYLRDAGYDTSAVTSHRFFSTPSGMRQGFIHFDEELILTAEDPTALVSSAGVSDRGIAWLRHAVAADNGLPWLLWLHYFDPHHDYVAHPRQVERFGAERAVERYRGEIRHTDRHVGRVLDTLEELGVDDETVVLLFADHGEEFGDHGGTKHGHTLFRELVRVPLILRAPGLEPRRVEGNVRMADLLPTVLELAGVGTRPDLAGRSLLPLARGGELADEPTLLELSIDEGKPLDAVVSGRWKLIRHGSPPRVELYDLRADPAERQNLAAEQPERVERLSALLDHLLAEARAASLDYHQSVDHGLTQAEIEELRRLGYVGDG